MIFSDLVYSGITCESSDW